MIPALLFMSRREWEELKLACKEAAGWRCEFVYPNGARCANHEGMDIYKGFITINGQRRRKKSTMHMHACHIDNDPENNQPRLQCRCPKHHTQIDRHEEKKEQPSWYRRGYQLTTTDRLLEEANSRGVTITEAPDGYHWSLDGEEDLRGTSTTAVKAVGTVIQELSYLLTLKKRELDRARQEVTQLRSQMESPPSPTRTATDHLSTISEGLQEIGR